MNVSHNFSRIDFLGVTAGGNRDLQSTLDQEQLKWRSATGWCTACGIKPRSFSTHALSKKHAAKVVAREKHEEMRRALRGEFGG